MAKCECCGFEQEGTPEELYDMGWDTPESFEHRYTVCDLCPVAFKLKEERLGFNPHDEVHDRWMITGRPEQFSPDESCLPVAEAEKHRNALASGDPVMMGLMKYADEHGSEGITELKKKIFSGEIDIVEFVENLRGNPDAKNN